MTTGTETEVPASQVQTGWLLRDRSLPGTHGDRVVVQWVGHHDLRKRTYIAGIEESTRHPVQLAYDDSKLVKVWRDS